ncbi:MAG: DNA primase family protein, partial [Thermodesulfobium sp.]
MTKLKPYLEPTLQVWQPGKRALLTLAFSGFLRKKLGLSKEEAKEIIKFITLYTNDEENRDSLIDGTYDKQIDEIAIKEWAQQAQVEDWLQKLYGLLSESAELLPWGIFKYDKNGNPIKIDIPELAKYILSKENLIALNDEIMNYNEEIHIWGSEGEGIIDRYLHLQQIEPFYSDYLRREVISFIKTKKKIRVEELNKGFGDGFINFRNGEVNIRTLEIVPHNPEHYFTWVLDYDFSSGLELPKEIFKTLMTWSYPDPEKFVTMLEALAYPFTPEYKIKKAFLLVGERDRGKSKFLQLFDYILSEENTAHVELKTLLHDSWSRLQLLGKLANIYSDLSESKINTAEAGIFKMLTGEDYMDLRLMHTQKFVRLYNTAKMYFSANMPPDFDVSINDAAFMSRWQFLTFDNDIINKDLDLIKKLREDIPKLYPWLLLIARKLEEQKNLTYYQNIDEIKSIYSATSARAIDKFVYAYLQYDPSAKTKISDIYDAINKFCKENGYSEVNQTEMGRKIKATFPVSVKQVGPNKEKYYIGLKLLDTPLSQDEESKVEKDEYIEKIYLYITQFTQLFQSSSVLTPIKNDIKYEKNGINDNNMGGYMGKYFEKTCLTGLLNEALANITAPSPSPGTSPDASALAPASPEATAPTTDTPPTENLQQNANKRKETQTCEICGKETDTLYEYAGLHVCIDCLNAKQ